MEQVSNSVHGFRSKFRNPEYKRKFIYSLVMFLAFVFLGVRSAQHGPAFLDLAQITNTNVEQASVFYTSMSVGSLIGTFCMGFVYDKLVNHSHLLIGATCILATVTTAAIPWSTNFPLTIALFLASAVFSAGFDIGGNADFMRVWGNEGKMYMQFLHFSYALGTIIAPFTVEPFLSHPITPNNSNCPGIEFSTQGQNGFANDSNPAIGGFYSFNGSDEDKSHLLNISIARGVPSVNSSKGSHIDVNISKFDDENCILSESRVQFAYLIAGVMCFISGVAIIGEGIFNRKTKSEHAKEDGRNTRELPRWLTVVMLVLLGSLYFFHLGCSVIVVGYMMAFVVNGLGWSKEDGTKLASAFFTSFAVFRLVGVLSAKFLSPSKMLFISNSTVIISFIGLWISTIYSCTWGVWLSLTLTAAGLAAIFPSGIVFLETRVMKMTGKVASVIWIGANSQGIVNPLLIGYLMQDVSHLWYLYLGFIEATLCLLSYCLLEVMVQLFVSKHKREVTIEVENDESKNKFIIDDTKNSV